MSDKNEAKKENTKVVGKTKKRERRPEFVQTRKSVPYTIQTQSNTMLDYMTRNGGAAAGAFQRVAGLIQLTTNDALVRPRLDKWFENVVSNAVVRADSLTEQQEKYSEGLVFNVPKPKVPENYKYTFEITHPIFWQLIGLIEKIDNVMAEIEFYWLSGQLEDVHLENAAGQAVNTIKTMVNRIYYVTNASRGRKGGLYSKEAYEELMVALVKNEESPESHDDASVDVDEVTEPVAAVA